MKNKIYTLILLTSTSDNILIGYPKSKLHKNQWTAKGSNQNIIL